MPFDTFVWEKISGFRLDDPASAFPFSARLAREQGWGKAFTLKAIEEYRRFIYLACIAGHMVTPSEEVDAVWHLHLTYSQSYWKDLCRDTLERPLHHGPTRGGAEARERYREAYGQTLTSYEAAFGETPPAAFWPEPAARFAPRTLRQVDCSTHWVIPKKPFKSALAIARRYGLPASFLAGSTGMAIDAGKEAVFWGMNGTQWLIFGAIATVIALAALSKKKRDNSGSGCGTGCSSDSGCSGCGD